MSFKKESLLSHKDTNAQKYYSYISKMPLFLVLPLVFSILSALYQSLFSDTKAIIPENQYRDIIEIQGGLVDISWY